MLTRHALATLALLGAAAAQKECTVAYTEGQDDSPAIVQAFTECAENAVITFQQRNYSAYTPMTFANLSACIYGIGSHFADFRSEQRT